jgi:hypothetical protein
MTEPLEHRIRNAVRSVDSLDVGAPEAVLRGAGTRARRRRQRTNVARVGASISAVALVIAGLVALSGRDTTTEIAAPTQPSSVPPTSTPSSTTPSTTPVTSAVAPESRWRPIAPRPDGVGWDLAAVWMGEEAFVLGAHAHAYDPRADRWRALAPFPATWTDVDACQDTPATCIGQPIGERAGGYFGANPIVEWTGDAVLVVGGDVPVGAGAAPTRNPVKPSAVRYVPSTDRWESLASPPWFMTDRSPHVWTGTELLVWPWDTDSNADPAYAFDPAANTWRALPEVPIAPRQNAASVWSGTEWIVWSGADDARALADGAAFDPATDRWRLLAEAPISARKAAGVWTGTELVVMAGSIGGGTEVCCGNSALTDGAAYDPATDTWRSLSGTVGHPGFEPLWADGVLLMFAKGGVVVYEPATGRFIDVCCEGMAGSTHVWTGSEALSFGSSTTDRGGGIFTPP